MSTENKSLVPSEINPITNEVAIMGNIDAVEVPNFEVLTPTFNVSGQYIEVEMWQEKAKEGEYLYCILAGQTIMDTPDKATGEMKLLPAVMLIGFFSKDGKKPDGAAASLFVAAQYGIVSPLKSVPKNAKMRIQWTGKKKTSSGHNMQVFSIEILS